MPTPPRSFRTQEDFRNWLEKHHASEKELILRLFKVHARDRGIGYKEALDEALCFGWIDGVGKSFDEDSFTRRFTPRKKKSNWSVVNIKRFNELQREGRIRPPGLAAFEARGPTAASPYSDANRNIKLAPELEKQFRANKPAWEFFTAQAPSYQRLMIFRVMSAKRDETRARRFSVLLDRSAKGKRLDLLRPNR
jgi:uncharacterized protein YdeI (YjbR/CyaY-like superfamily)